MGRLIDPDKLELAKGLLLLVLSDKPRTLAEVYAFCKAQCPLKKSEIKAARKELGVISREENGIWYWSLPKQPE